MEDIIKYVEYVERFNELNNAINYGSLTLSEVHCVDAIKKLDKANVTNIAKAMKMTKGTISKVSKKLLEKEYISKYRLEGNKKEVLFELREKGEELFELHEKVHEKAIDREMTLLKNFDLDEKRAIKKFFEVMNKDLAIRIEEIEMKKASC